MQIELTSFDNFILKKIAAAANELGVETYAVGGFVRDKILQRQTKDLDIVCVGDGIKLAEAVAEKFNPKPTVSFFKNFGTAQIKIKSERSKVKNKDDIDDDFFEIEFVGARKESYRADSRKPEIEIGTLQDDQNRRDFTINTLAISLNKSNYGSLLDSFNGVIDIENKLIQTPLDADITFI